jgi:hypothetical protein
MITYRRHPNYKYQLLETATFPTPFRPNSKLETDFGWLDIDGTVTILPGYAWDGCSGPTVDTKDSMRAGLIHDFLYGLMRAQLLARTDFNRKQADDLFKKTLREDGMGAIRAGYWHQAVRMFGGPSTHPKQDNKYKERLVAP